ncbi:c-type cytochrome [Massilia putida]|uniref:c-type cytochrome n=1 Tax=Massilia putida TaxID=1141883 RepID=UPI000B1704C6|nr:c-type cytochrome [Massilia putida]
MTGRLSIMLMCALALAACSKTPSTPEPITGGDPRAGRALLARYGCASCHKIKGIAHADSQVGPPLDAIRSRGYIAGVLPHDTDNLIKWIRHPRQVVPGTAMPELGVSEAEARDMAAYLYSQ